MSESLENKYWAYNKKSQTTAYYKNIKPMTKGYIIQYTAQAKKFI